MHRSLLAALACLTGSLAFADETRVAVAANFAAPAKQISDAFERATGHKVTLITGSTGKFYAQIINGAPFDVLLSADDETPEKLEKSGHAVPGTRFTYAIGRLVLWSAKPGFVDGGSSVLQRDDFRHLAIANPKVAPYGQAAMEVLTALGLAESLRSRFVLGENIAQTHQFAASGNAELGFVALSQVARGGKLATGSGWIVPANLHQPIRQDAVLLAGSRDSQASRAFLAWLSSDRSKGMIQEFGYDLK